VDRLGLSPSLPSSPPDHHRRLDALTWLLVPALALAVLPNGFLSADGLGQSLIFAAGRWHLNPNHLLFDPLAAGWITLWKLAGCDWHPADVLKVLSGISGAVALALFRLLVAPRLAATRWLANQATAYVAFSSAFLRLWVADEVQMVQMPLVVLVAALAVRRIEEDRRGLSLLLGVAVGLAALCFVSNALLGVTLAAAISWRHLTRREPRRAAASVAAIAAGMTLAAGLPLLAAWLPRVHAVGFVDWLTRYDGGASSTRVTGAYGVVVSPSGVLTALVRAAYGAASSLVDLTAPAAMLRDRQPATLAALFPALAFAAAVAALATYGIAAWRGAPNGRAERSPVLLLALAWVSAILAFGVFWDNSDDQFYFQLAPIFGAIAASVPAARRRRSATRLGMVLGAAALLWNVVDVATHRLLYPRAERVALIEREVAGACLVVLPGFDEAQLLLSLSLPARRVPRLSIVDLALAEPSATGLPRLTKRIDACLARRGHVVLLDVFATPQLRSPWKYLLRLGYERRAVEAALAAIAGETPTRRSGPFTVREIGRPPAGNRRAPGSSPASRR
jgi:hypothetical protein